MLFRFVFLEVIVIIIPLDVIKQRVYSVNPNVEMIDGYTGATYKARFKCVNCNHEWYVAPNTIIYQKSGCPKCANEKQRCSHDEFLDKIKNRNELIPLEQYKKADIPILFKCNICKHEWESTPRHILSGGKCPYCTKEHRYDTMRISKENFLNKLEKNNPEVELIGEYIDYSTPTLFRCKRCGYEWDALPTNIWRKRTKGNNCPVCCDNHHIIVQGYNDLKTLRPDLIKYLKNKNEIYSMTSTQKIITVCPQCGTEKTMTVNNLTNKPYSCPVCSDGVSFPNKLSRCMLKQLPVENLEFEWRPKWADKKRYDNYFEYNNQKYILEMDGGFHYKASFNTTIEDIKNTDKIKDKLAYEHGINIIRINCSNSNDKYIIKNIMQSELSTIFDLSIIDWNQCIIDAQTNLFTETINMFNDGMIVKEISEKLHLCQTTVRNYLHRGYEYNLCNYPPIYVGRKRKTPVVCYDKNGNFTEYETITQCTKCMNEIYNTNVDSRVISRCCRSKSHKYKDFFIYYKNPECVKVGDSGETNN